MLTVYMSMYIHIWLMALTVGRSRGTPHTVNRRETTEQGSANLCFVMLGTTFLTSYFEWTDNDFGNDNIVYLLVRLM